MIAYDKRRLVNWICYHMRSGKSLSAILEAAAARKPPFPPEWVREMYPHAIRACKNTGAINQANPFQRLCDICDIPEE